MSDVVCPVCDSKYSTQGFGAHLNSHNKDEIVSSVAEALRNGRPTQETNTVCQTGQVEEITTKATKRVEELKEKSEKSRQSIDKKVNKTLQTNA